MKSSLEDNQEVNRVILRDVKIQEDVGMYMQSPDYYDLRGWDFAIGADLTAITKRINE